MLVPRNFNFPTELQESYVRLSSIFTGVAEGGWVGMVGMSIFLTYMCRASTHISDISLVQNLVRIVAVDGEW